MQIADATGLKATGPTVGRPALPITEAGGRGRPRGRATAMRATKALKKGAALRGALSANPEPVSATAGKG